MLGSFSLLCKFLVNLCLNLLQCNSFRARRALVKKSLESLTSSQSFYFPIEVVSFGDTKFLAIWCHEQYRLSARYLNDRV